MEAKNRHRLRAIPKERFESLPDDVRARLAARGIDPDRSLQGLLNEIRTGRRFGELLAALTTKQT